MSTERGDWYARACVRARNRNSARSGGCVAESATAARLQRALLDVLAEWDRLVDRQGDSAAIARASIGARLMQLRAAIAVAERETR